VLESSRTSARYWEQFATSFRLWFEGEAQVTWNMFRLLEPVDPEALESLSSSIPLRSTDC
jgi:hypothetical protein